MEQESAKQDYSLYIEKSKKRYNLNEYCLDCPFIQNIKWSDEGTFRLRKMKWFPLTRWQHVCQVKLLSKVGYNQLDGQDAGEIKMFAAFNNPVQYLLCHKTKPGNFAA